MIHFTVGQRKGLGLSGNDEPLFVLKLDAQNARVIVGPREALRVRDVRLRDVNWLATAGANRMRREGALHAPAVAAIVTPEENGARVELLGFEEAVAPGQACVFYKDGRVLGGGTILRDQAASKAA